MRLLGAAGPGTTTTTGGGGRLQGRHRHGSQQGEEIDKEASERNRHEAFLSQPDVQPGGLFLHNEHDQQ